MHMYDFIMIFHQHKLTQPDIPNPQRPMDDPHQRPIHPRNLHDPRPPLPQ